MRENKKLFAKHQTLGLRLVFVLVLSAIVMVVDSRQNTLDSLRQMLSVLVYPVQSIIQIPFSLVRWGEERLTSRRDLEVELERLRTQRLLMDGQLEKLAALEAENSRLRELLRSSYRTNERLSIAEILRLDTGYHRQQIVINRGASEGLMVGQPIIDASGIMGQINTVELNTATALLITDINHAIAVEVNRNGLRTVVAGTGKLNQLDLPFLTNNSDIKQGDLLVSSGMDGRFPKGYPVAVVTLVERSSAESFARIHAEPVAKLDRAREVLLVWPAKKNTPTDVAPDAKPSSASANMVAP